jgi:hypothetical protein
MNDHYPKLLSDFGLTIDQYNTFAKQTYLKPFNKLSADMWFGTCCGRPIDNFSEIARIRNLSPTTVRRHIIWIIQGLNQYVKAQKLATKLTQYKSIEDDLLRLSLALFIEQETPFISHLTYEEDNAYLISNI